jgi:hypothetical protein
MPGFELPGVELGKVSYFREEKTIGARGLLASPGLLEGQRDRVGKVGW